MNNAAFWSQPEISISAPCTLPENALPGTTLVSTPGGTIALQDLAAGDVCFIETREGQKREYTIPAISRYLWTGSSIPHQSAYPLYRFEIGDSGGDIILPPSLSPVMDYVPVERARVIPRSFYVPVLPEEAFVMLNGVLCRQSITEQMTHPLWRFIIDDAVQPLYAYRKGALLYRIPSETGRFVISPCCKNDSLDFTQVTLWESGHTRCLESDIKRGGSDVGSLHVERQSGSVGLLSIQLYPSIG